MRSFTGILLLLAASLVRPAKAQITLDTSSEDSIISACATIASGLMNYYHGNESGYTPGIFSGDYYWWESGAAWGSLIDYQFYTGDDQYNDLILNGMIFQVGDNWDYAPANQTSSLGNDDQGFWGLAAMQAAERNFTNPADDKPQWLALAQAVFNSIALVWGTDVCDGGVRWQKFVFNNGYDYKNSISNGILLQLGGRLARYTGNDTYADWAEKVWQWEEDTGLITSDYFVYDGASTDDDCATIDSIQWTYNMGVFMAGCAYMYNYTYENGNSTAADTWKTRLDGLIGTLHVFISDSTDIVYEPACEVSAACDVDQQSFKAYLARFMGLTIQVAPYTYDTLFPVIQASAAAAIATCSGGTDGVTCGYTWLTGAYDGSYGLGEQMAALEMTQQLMIAYGADVPYTNSTGGSSTGDASGGTKGTSADYTGDMTTKDKAGAWAITVVICLVVVLATVWCGMEGTMEGTKNLKEWIRLDDL
ncbi:glycosyl hydrolase family 76-domain-containing protein [Myxozyma melibiosi]|uniref:Mannan endo-1,6-alpha-mannosidase n=1 Tax=Myxozyma melibiosi TaxID=54550 RepID=A0ABR1FFQ3_9ASCO